MDETILHEALLDLLPSTETANWSDVLRRAEPRFAPPDRARPPRRRPGLRAAIAVAAAVVAIVVATPAFGIGARVWDLIAGTPVAPQTLSSSDWQILSASGGGWNDNPPKSLSALGIASLNLVASRNGRSFYILERTDGTTCYAEGQTGGLRISPAQPNFGNAEGSLLGQMHCPGAGDTFPSRQDPIENFSPRVCAAAAGCNSLRDALLGRLSGFASDAVASVGVIGTDGKLYDLTPVIDNVYENNTVPPVPPERFVAFDSAGNQVYSSGA